MKREKWLLTVVFFAIVILFSACGKKGPVTVDYADEELFEAALNSGEDLTGKTVNVVVEELNPESAYGYNIWAGEHLNFVSDKNPKVEKGDIVTVKVTSVSSVFGSWIIYYEKIGVNIETKSAALDYSAVGTYIGENGSIFSIHKDGTATYFWYGWSSLSEGNEWTESDTEADIYLKELDCHITFKLIGKNMKISFVSDSKAWDNEKFTKIEERDRERNRQEYIELLADNEEIFISGVSYSFKRKLDNCESVIVEWLDLYDRYKKLGYPDYMKAEYEKLADKADKAVDEFIEIEVDKLEGPELAYYAVVYDRIQKRGEESGL